MKTRDQAIDQVKVNNKAYYLTALAFAEEWIKNRFKSFSSEDLKEAFYEAGNPEPNEPRVFGAVINELKKQNLIKFHSYQIYKSRAGHGRPSTVWISKVYSEKQSANRKLDTTQINLFEV
jgi:hypothetical protein